MRSFINSIFLSESWAIGNPFLNIGSGSVWYLLDKPEDIEAVGAALKIRDRGSLANPAYLLVHDNSPVMLATVDPHTGHVNQAYLQGGAQADAGWSRYTHALEQKLMGNEGLEEEDAFPMMEAEYTDFDMDDQRGYDYHGYTIYLSVWDDGEGGFGGSWVVNDPEGNRFEDDYPSKEAAEKAVDHHLATGEELPATLSEDDVVGSVVPGTRKPQGFLRVNTVMHQIAQTPAPKSPDDAARLLARVNDLCDAVEQFAERRANEGQHGLSLELRKAVNDARAMFPRGDAEAIMANPHTPENCRRAIDELRDALYTAGIMVEDGDEPYPSDEQILGESLGDFSGCAPEIQDLASDIDLSGGDPIIYSGRSMYGAQCIGFTAEYRFEIEDVVARLIQRNDLGEKLAGPNIDQMGRGFVAYWPWLKIEEPKKPRAAQDRLKDFSLPK